FLIEREETVGYAFQDACHLAAQFGSLLLRPRGCVSRLAGLRHGTLCLLVRGVLWVHWPSWVPRLPVREVDLCFWIAFWARVQSSAHRALMGAIYSNWR